MNSLGGVFTLLMAIVGVATLTVAVTHTGTADIIKAFGSVFQGSLATAMGR